uniref:Variant surface glycoprotein 1125.447 n=1 Tax=Trypanosoma brucei TaxID=5691 RepID=A0A1J0R5W2_9TRYP|nr:variant surface glycoprotein 1125.447 [Trypanosoma brucei]
MLVALLILVKLIHPASAAASDVAAGSNKREHAVVCNLMQLATGDPFVSGCPDDISDEVMALNVMNMSVAEESWKSKFIGESDAALQWSQELVTAKGYPETWANHWPVWTQAAKRARSDEQTRHNLKEAQYSMLSPEERKAAQQELRAILNATAGLIEVANNLKAEISNGDKAKVKEFLNEAAYGAKTGKGNYEQAGERGTGVNAKATCNDGGKVGKQQTLAQVLICLCATDTGGPAENVCTAVQELTADWTNNAANMATTGLTNILTSCRLSETKQTRPEAIYAALSIVEALIQVKAGDGYLGHTKTGQCTGSQSQGMCVKYASYVTGDKATFSQIEWVAKLLAAADAMHRRHAACIEYRNIKHSLTVATAQAWHIPASIKLRQVSGKKAAADENTNSKKSEANKQQENVECKAIKQAAKCREKQPTCEWKGKNDNDGEHCKLNETNVSKQESQAATDGETSGADPNCGQYTDPDKCSKAPGKPKEGKKSVCGWIEGKCQDSSFLVNKQFALSVATAIVGFVEFYKIKNFGQFY